MMEESRDTQRTSQAKKDIDMQFRDGVLTIKCAKDVSEGDKQFYGVTLKKEDPGLFESIGSFPVWLLRLIDLLTPDFLIKKVPPRKNKP